jgi:hypothetical protein
MSVNDRDIDALLDVQDEHYRAILTALVAERDGLRAALADARRDRASSKSVLASVIAEREALKQRVEELEAHPPADRDRELRERLVCAALGGVSVDALLTQHANRMTARHAVELADAVLAAMRKEEQP